MKTCLKRCCRIRRACAKKARRQVKTTRGDDKMAIMGWQNGGGGGGWDGILFILKIKARRCGRRKTVVACTTIFVSLAKQNAPPPTPSLYLQLPSTSLRPCLPSKGGYLRQNSTDGCWWETGVSFDLRRLFLRGGGGWKGIQTKTVYTIITSHL